MFTDVSVHLAMRMMGMTVWRLTSVQLNAALVTTRSSIVFLLSKSFKSLALLEHNHKW